MKVATIVGARPQFIKAAPVSLCLQQAGIDEILIHTGQHYDVSMSDVFFEELGLRQPDYHLEVGSGAHGRQTGLMLERIETTFERVRPDWVLLFGDTNSTLAGALAAAKMHIPIAHVEAGLRSFNRGMPEEINRVVADHLSALLFCPTSNAVNNLAAEGITGETVEAVGDVMFDAALMFETVAARSKLLTRLGLLSKKFVLATIHRAENTATAERLNVIFDGLTHVCASIPVVIPLHPRTKVALSPAKQKAFLEAGGLILEPVGYIDMITLERNAAVVATDSGGVQKEAFFYGTPCVVLRAETEWGELVDLGWNSLVSPDSAEKIRQAVIGAIGRRGRAASPYGAGDAGAKIAASLRNFGV